MTKGTQESPLESNPRVSENVYYGKHINGIPFNPGYQDGMLVRNPRGEEFPHRVYNKEGKVVQYSRWERRNYSKAKGRPRIYTDEERLERKREASRNYYFKKQQEKANEND